MINRFFASAAMLSLSAVGLLASVDSEVTVRNNADDVTLAGTLALPQSQKPKAFVVFASGSGAQNRDEEVLGLKPFKVLSNALTDAGYGTLRLDDRGVGQSTGTFSSATLDNFTGDVVSAVNYVREAFPDTPVGILGHSQGGQVAVKAAACGNCDFIITLAGPAWPGDSLIMSQCRALAVASTGSWPNEPLQRRLLDIAKSPLPDMTAKILLYNEFESAVGEMAKAPQMQSYILEQIAPVISPMYRDLLRYDPEEDIRNVRVPWLALNGDKDLQVLIGNLETIRSLNPGAVTVTLPGYNHLFQKAVTGLPNEYATGGQSPDPEVVTIIVTELENLLKR